MFGIGVFMATAVHAYYINGWDQEANFNCPSGQIISYIGSIHSNYYEDRRWEYRCRTPRTGRLSSCIDSGYVNSYDQSLTYLCPGNRVMTGMYSSHSNFHDDRIFGFRCCSVGQRVPSNCYTTGYVNRWDGPMTLIVPEGQAITQALSHHNNFHEDRRWQFTLCTI